MSGVEKKSVTDDESGMRLDRWFRVHYPDIKHGQLEKLLRKGEIRVNGGRAKANHRLQSNDEIRIPPLHDGAPQSSRKELPASADDLRDLKKMIVFEDDDILALNKPFGLPVQGGSKTKRHIDGMLSSLGTGDNRPRLVHRLDKDTGGLLLVAKNRKSAQRLADAFQGRSVEKTYWALLAGTPRPSEGTIEVAIAKRMIRLRDGDSERVVAAEGEDAKNAVSHFQTVETAGPVTFVAMRPVTGRTHQLRVHAAAIDCPVVGDQKYGGGSAQIEGVSQKLHLFCREMTFAHPRTGQRTTLSAPLTGHMLETWKFFGFPSKTNLEWPEEA